MNNINKKVAPKHLQKSIKVYPVGNNKKKIGWVNNYLKNLPKMSYTITKQNLTSNKKAVIEFEKYAGKKINIRMGPHNSALITTDYATEIHIENLDEIELMLNLPQKRETAIIATPSTSGRIYLNIPESGMKSILKPVAKCSTNRNQMSVNELNNFLDKQFLDIKPEICDLAPELVPLEPEIVEFKFDMFDVNPQIVDINPEVIEILDDSDDEHKQIIEAPFVDLSMVEVSDASDDDQEFTLSQCPICFEITSPRCYMKSAINVCLRCSKLLHPKVNKEVFIKNTILSPCTNSTFGCSSFYNEPNKDKHLKMCVYRKRDCFVTNCNWVGSPNDFLLHILSNHSNNIRFGHVQDIDINLINNPDNIYIIIAFESKEMFIIGTIFDCFNLNIFTVYTGNSNKAANFMYAIQIKDANRIVRNCYKYSQTIENIELENIRELGIRLKFNEILAYTKNDTFKLRIILQQTST